MYASQESTLFSARKKKLMTQKMVGCEIVRGTFDSSPELCRNFCWNCFEIYAARTDRYEKQSVLDMLKTIPGTLHWQGGTMQNTCEE